MIKNKRSKPAQDGQTPPNPNQTTFDAALQAVEAQDPLNEPLETTPGTTSPAVINETVLAAKEFLDAELAKYDDWNHADKNIRVLFVDYKGISGCRTGKI